MWKKTRFHFVYCHTEEIPGWATDGRVHKCILKYAYEIGSDNEISRFDFLWFNLAVGPVCLKTILILRRQFFFFFKNMQLDLKYLPSVG